MNLLLVALLVLAAIVALFLPGNPLKRFFARPEIKVLARAMRGTRPGDWTVGPHYATCARLDLKVWHANEGYAFKAWLSRDEHGFRVCDGGADGEALWHEFKRIRLASVLAHIQRAAEQSA